MGGSSTASAASTFAEAGIPAYFDPVRAVGALDALEMYATVQSREYTPPAAFDVDRERAASVLADATERGRTLLGVEAMGLLEAYGIDTPAGAVVDSPGEAGRTADRVGGDVVMKVVSPDVSHKSDIGGVEVGVPPDAAPDTYEGLVVRARNYQPDATAPGVQVQELVDLEAGTEVIVGITRDPQFGPLVMVGLGGIFVEVMEDTAFRVAPVSEPEIRGMFEELDSIPLLYGARGRDPADVDALVETIQRVSHLVTDFPEIAELDINPVVAQRASRRSTCGSHSTWRDNDQTTRHLDRGRHRKDRNRDCAGEARERARCDGQLRETERHQPREHCWRDTRPGPSAGPAGARPRRGDARTRAGGVLADVRPRGDPRPGETGTVARAHHRHRRRGCGRRGPDHPGGW